MIKHIVLWKLHDRGNAGLIRQTLEALPARIPQIHKLEVGTGMPAGDFSADVALYSEFRTEADLRTYIAHPAHQEAVAIIVPLVSERRVADYSA
jgi:hypothetical protein